MAYFMVKGKDGDETYFNRKCVSVGIFETEFAAVLAAAQRFADKIGGEVFIEDSRPYCFVKDGKCSPRWIPLSRIINGRIS